MMLEKSQKFGIVLTVFDLWCRGQNLIGFAETIVDAVDAFKRICAKKALETKAKV